MFAYGLRRRQWQPTPVLLPGKSHGRRSRVGCSPWGREESDTTERLHFHFSLSCFGAGNGNPLQCSCLENPRGRGAWWAAVYGVAQSRHHWSNLAAAAAAPSLSLLYTHVYRAKEFTVFPMGLCLSIYIIHPIRVWGSPHPTSLYLSLLQQSSCFFYSLSSSQGLSQPSSQSEWRLIPNKPTCLYLPHGLPSWFYVYVRVCVCAYVCV